MAGKVGPPCGALELSQSWNSGLGIELAKTEANALPVNGSNEPPAAFAFLRTDVFDGGAGAAAAFGSAFALALAAGLSAPVTGIAVTAPPVPL